MQKFQAAYNKCVKLFFGYERWYSMSAVFLELSLPTLATILHNAQYKFKQSVKFHVNSLVRYIAKVCNAELV